jgi:hypothetical protein
MPETSTDDHNGFDSKPSEFITFQVKQRLRAPGQRQRPAQHR